MDGETAPGTQRRAGSAHAPALARPAALAGKVLLGMAAFGVFVEAIQLLKTGAKAVTPLAREVLHIHGPLNALGFGWLLSYLDLSGAPIAVTALTLFASNVLDKIEAFSMIAGARLGGTFVVLLVGFLYQLRKSRRKGMLTLEAGVLTLLTSFSIYGTGIVIGFALLELHVLDAFTISTPPTLLNFIDLTFGALAKALAERVPPLLVFASGVGAVLLAFRLFDRALPDLSRRTSRFARVSEAIYRPSLLFALGAGVTVLTLSRAVSLSLLVPLTAKGIIRRENVVPYVMGADVGTFVDTLFASVLVGGAAAFTIVLAELVGVLAVCLLVIAFAYDRFEEGVYRSSRAVLRSRRTVALFVMVIFICPLLLLLL
jgi:Na+/phosphate symporter